MSLDIPALIAKRLNINIRNVEATLGLLDEGATIPFISRYRKEYTGNLNEIQIRDIETLYAELKEFEKRRDYILKAIGKAGALTPELKTRIESTNDINVIEDIYLPYKPKRRTRATIARDKGLEPLAKIIMKQNSPRPLDAIPQFINESVPDRESVLAGVNDIIAEWVSDNSVARAKLRKRLKKEARIFSKTAKGVDAEDLGKFSMYADFCVRASHCPSHQYLAMRRGEREGVLSISVKINDEEAIKDVASVFVRKSSSDEVKKIISDAVVDSYRRLLFPSLENEIAGEWKKRADEDAIQLFAENLRELLMSSPLANKRIMGVDPGFRTGCKIVCLDKQGALLHHDVIYPQRERVTSALKISKLVGDYEIDAIALGNGTASRETEQFLQVVHFPRRVQVVVVSESGASIYSASEVARREFPDHDVTVRGAVSIGRRLLDPLAELVKIDPKSIGVGQYQHDVDQNALKDSLDYTVMSCVNSVGVDVNTASAELLSYISGIGPMLAGNIITYRNENGRFKSRKELMKVPRMGEKAFQQAAGFLRIPDAVNPLDRSAVHPERYTLVEKIATDLDIEINELVMNKEQIDRIDIEKYVDESTGLPTLKDIVEELRRPGRDPRQMEEPFEFDPNVLDIYDLTVGMELNGIVNNITAFGAFVDIGVHESGLVHISQLSEKRVTRPQDVVKINQRVRVKVIDVDTDRCRIALSMKGVKQ